VIRASPGPLELIFDELLGKDGHAGSADMASTVGVASERLLTAAV
jgi:hypothetical protein